MKTGLLRKFGDMRISMAIDILINKILGMNGG